MTWTRLGLMLYFLHDCPQSCMSNPVEGLLEVKEVFDQLDKVGADVVLFHGCPQNCMPNPAKCLLEVYEDMVEVLLVLGIFLTEDS